MCFNLFEKQNNMMTIQLNDEKTQLEFLSNNPHDKISCTNTEEIISMLFFHFVLGNITLTQVKIALSDLDDSLIKPYQPNCTSSRLIEEFRRLLGLLVDLDEVLILEHLIFTSGFWDFCLIDNKRFSTDGEASLILNPESEEVPVLLMGFSGTFFSIPIYSRSEGEKLAQRLVEKGRLCKEGFALLLVNLVDSKLPFSIQYN